VEDETRANIKLITDEAFKTTSESHKKLTERSDVLFEQLISQQQQLFAVALAKLSDNATIGTKALDIGPIEASADAIAAKIAELVIDQLGKDK